ncbi:MFS general substrate transporter [Schizopora paradoxa]|uniref:MFS general substrate transporter n=1 Tax=Schizopora paradoxa TaxID=27342 RepID=A0A0H2S8P5_9AGAM|nr:MFS general substrate transporter [Schizopora paradoxa]
MEIDLPPPPPLSGHTNGLSSAPLSPTDTLVEEPTLPTKNQPASSDVTVTKTCSITDEKDLHDSTTNTVNVIQDDEQRPSDGPGDGTSTTKKYVLLIVFCLAQFLDAVNNSAIFPAIPTLAIDLNIKTNNTVWVISATQLTFASFLLLSGRISDVYSAKYAFVVGISVLGLISLGMGFVRNQVGLFILRALSGAFGSLTIPSALNLIVRVFPEALEQSRAIATFGTCGTIGNLLGLFIGAIFVEFATWSWVFWFVAIIAVPVSVIAVWLIPNDSDKSASKSKMKGLDLIGVSVLTAALVLFIYGLTTGSNGKWNTVGVIVPLVIAVCLFVSFFYYETRIPEESAALPPRTWKYPNFKVLLGTALMPYFWWTTCFIVFSTYWQDVLQWSAVSSVLRQIPLSIAAFAISFTGPLSRTIHPKRLILTGQIMTIIATILMPFAGGADRYWPIVFPAFAVGSAGTMLVYTHTNIAIFRSTPSRMAGTVGAIFNSALQLGSAIGSAAVTSISTSIDESAVGETAKQQYRGRAAAFWFLLACVVIQALVVLVFYHPKRLELDEDESISSMPTLEEKEEEEKSVSVV